MLRYDSIEGLVQEADARGKRISEIVMEDQAESMEISVLELYEKMEIDFFVMRESVLTGGEQDQRSMSGLTGGEGYLMGEYAASGRTLCGEFLAKAMARALSVAGCNASMGRIVAAPTAGSCGILPGCLITLTEEGRISEREAVEAMFTA